MEKNTHKISPVAAGITGLVLGIVGTAAVALSDKQTRTKMTKKANEVKDNLEKWSKDTLHDLHAASSDMQQKAADKVKIINSIANFILKLGVAISLLIVSLTYFYSQSLK